MKGMSQQEAYQDRVKAMLNLWSVEISRLRARARLLEADARIEAVKRLEELERLYHEAFQRYVGMTTDTNARLDDLKATFEHVAGRVREAIDNLTKAVA